MKGKVVDRDRVLRPGWWFFAAIVFLLVAAIRIRLLGIPLERDEGEYAYVGQLMLGGIPPYKLAYNMKFPGTYAAYAAIMATFGQTPSGIHLGLLVINAATSMLIYFLGRRLGDFTTGIAAAIAYMILSLSSTVLGLAAHATHFVMLPVVGAILLLVTKADRRVAGTLFASGLLFGIGLLMKQPAVFFILFGAIYLISNDILRGIGVKEGLVRVFIFGVGVIVPFGVTCLVLWQAGVFDKFWFWTIDYARQYATASSLKSARRVFGENVTEMLGADWMLWLLAGFGLVTGISHKATRAGTSLVLALLAASIPALSSGLYFRQHYFIFALPAVSLLVGIAITRLTTHFSSQTGIVRFVPLFLLVIAVGFPVFLEKGLLLGATPMEACREIYGVNPFPESVKIGEYVRNHTDSSDSIAVLGSEPQIYFYSGRHSATGYIYTYSLMEPQGYALQMQQEMIREIELARPKYVISVQIPLSWLGRPESETLILRWATEYLNKYYDLTGFVNIVGPDRTDYYFSELPATMPQLDNYILIYQRKS